MAARHSHPKGTHITRDVHTHTHTYTYFRSNRTKSRRIYPKHIEASARDEALNGGEDGSVIYSFNSVS